MEIHYLTWKVGYWLRTGLGLELDKMPSPIQGEPN